MARTKRGTALYSLHHVIDLDWMKEAYRLTRKDGAPGIDGVTAADYEVNLEANLLDLLDRIKSGCYRAPPVRRCRFPRDPALRPHGRPGPPPLSPLGRVATRHPRRHRTKQNLGASRRAFFGAMGPLAEARDQAHNQNGTLHPGFRHILSPPQESTFTIQSRGVAATKN